MNAPASLANERIADTLQHFGSAWAERDLDRVMTHFDLDAIYQSSIGPLPGGHAEGVQQIRALVSSMFATDDCVGQSVGAPIINGDRAAWTWVYDLASGDHEYGCDFFEFRANLIVLKDAYRKARPSILIQDTIK